MIRPGRAQALPQAGFPGPGGGAFQDVWIWPPGPRGCGVRRGVEIDIFNTLEKLNFQVIFGKKAATLRDMVRSGTAVA